MGIAAVLSYLVLGSDIIRAEEYCLLECKSQTEEMVQSKGSELVSFHLKGVLLGKSFAISKNWLALGGAVTPKSVRPQRPDHLEYRKYG